MIRPYSRSTVYHELGHYYFNSGNGPSWLSEGTADFLAGYTVNLEKTLALSLATTVQEASPHNVVPRAVTTIQDWIEASAGQFRYQLIESEFYSCQYPPSISTAVPHFG